jgi:DNA-binding NtrC family response regulator
VKKRILVVEDDANFGRVVVRILESAGYEPILAVEFATAIEVIESREQLHLLLADIQMPAGKPNGVTIARMAGLRRRQLPIIYMTGSHRIAQTTGSIEPDTPILRKPFSVEELLDAVRSAVS